MSNQGKTRGEFNTVFTFIDEHPEEGDRFMGVLHDACALASRHLDGLKDDTEPVVRKFFDGLPEAVRPRVTELMQEETAEVLALVAAGAVVQAVLRKGGAMGMVLALTSTKLASSIDIHFANDGATQGRGEA